MRRRSILYPTMLFVIIIGYGPSVQTVNASVKPTFAAGAGLCLPQGTVGRSYSAGWSWTGAVGLSLPTLPLDIRLDGGWDRVGTPGSWIGTPRTSGYFRAYGGTIQIVLRPVQKSHIVPYIFAGPGLVRIEQSFSDRYFETETHDTGTRGVLAVGMGLKMLWSGFGWFMEGRYIKIHSSGSLLRISLGFAYN
jgi:hypothetical protein